VNVTTIRNVGFVFPNRPDLVWEYHSTLMILLSPAESGSNSAAFVVRPQNRQGTLGRNELRGFALKQVDFALRRRFKLQRTLVALRAEVFNVFNHPNFADPDGNLGTFVNQLIPNNQFGRSLKCLVEAWVLAEDSQADSSALPDWGAPFLPVGGQIRVLKSTRFTRNSFKFKD